jgi:hypothetical protein
MIASIFPETELKEVDTKLKSSSFLKCVKPYFQVRYKKFRFFFGEEFFETKSKQSGREQTILWVKIACSMKRIKTNNQKDLAVKTYRLYYKSVGLPKLPSAFNSIISFLLNISRQSRKTSIGLFHQPVLLRYVSTGFR